MSDFAHGWVFARTQSREDRSARRNAEPVSAPAGRLRPGDLVQLRPPDEISASLDAGGALDDLPFMPEMLEFYGRRLRVARRALTVCYYGPGPSRRFHADNIVTLEIARCSGAAHNGCPKACTIFWNEAWLQMADRSTAARAPDPPAIERLRSRLRTSTDAKTFYCQASQLLRTTQPLSKRERVARYIRAFLAGNLNALEMANSVAIFIFWAARRRMFGAYPRGDNRKPQNDPLSLQPGDWVEIKPLKTIMESLDNRGANNGLLFTSDMSRWCGRTFQVRSRLDNIIVDGTGRTRKLRDTVILDGPTCGCAYMGLGMAGCARCEFTYWREAWLRRSCRPASETGSDQVVDGSHGHLGRRGEGRSPSA